MKITCRQYRSNLVAYYDQELPEHKMRALAQHLETCSACAQEFESLQKALTAIADIPVIQPSSDYDRVFWNKIRAMQHEQKKKLWDLASPLRFLFAQHRAITASVGIALCLCIASFVALRHQKELAADERAIAEHLDLFAHYEVIAQSDALEHFEIIKDLDSFAEDADR